MKILATLGLTASLSVASACAPAPAFAEGTCTFAAPVIIISLAAPVTLICGDSNITSTSQNNSLQLDPSLFGKAPTP